MSIYAQYVSVMISKQEWGPERKEPAERSGLKSEKKVHLRNNKVKTENKLQNRSSPAGSSSAERFRENKGQLALPFHCNGIIFF